MGPGHVQITEALIGAHDLGLLFLTFSPGHVSLMYLLKSRVPWVNLLLLFTYLDIPGEPAFSEKATGARPPFKVIWALSLFFFFL